MKWFQQELEPLHCLMVGDGEKRSYSTYKNDPSKLGGVIDFSALLDGSVVLHNENDQQDNVPDNQASGNYILSNFSDSVPVHDVSLSQWFLSTLIE